MQNSRERALSGVIKNNASYNLHNSSLDLIKSHAKLHVMNTRAMPSDVCDEEKKLKLHRMMDFMSIP